MPCATSDYRRVPHSSADPAGYGHPLKILADIVLLDLKTTTTKGKWWLGRKLKLRIHLGTLLLQWLYDLTDRQVEWGLHPQ